MPGPARSDRRLTRASASIRARKISIARSMFPSFSYASSASQPAAAEGSPSDPESAEAKAVNACGVIPGSDTKLRNQTVATRASRIPKTARANNPTRARRVGADVVKTRALCDSVWDSGGAGAARGARPATSVVFSSSAYGSPGDLGVGRTLLSDSALSSAVWSRVRMRATSAASPGRLSGDFSSSRKIRRSSASGRCVGRGFGDSPTILLRVDTGDLSE